MLSLGTPAQKDMKDVVEIAKPVFRMLKALLAHQGSLSQDDAEQDDPRVKARMRLQAASSLLHLCTLEKFEESLVESFMKLVIFIQVTLFFALDQILL
jgi:sister-chromatid-cohesion protein PDS5